MRFFPSSRFGKCQAALSFSTAERDFQPLNKPQFRQIAEGVVHFGDMHKARTISLATVLFAVSVIGVAIVLVTRSPAQEVQPGDREGDRATNSGAAASPTGSWKAVVDDQGNLMLIASQATAREKPISIASHVLPELAFSTDGTMLVYPQGLDGETKLMIMSVPPTGPPQVLVDWVAPVGLPVFAPDSRHLAFTSGDGFGAINVIDVSVGRPSTIQITNVGLPVTHEPGQAPDGFVPGPDSTNNLHWDGNRRLVWTNEGKRYSAELP